MVSDKFSCGENDFNYFIGLKSRGNIISICVKFPKMSGNIKGFGNTKFMWFLIKYKQLLKNYNEM